MKNQKTAYALILAVSLVLNSCLTMFLIRINKEKPEGEPGGDVPPVTEEPAQPVRETYAPIVSQNAQWDEFALLADGKYKQLVAHMVIDRQVIPDSYLVFLEDEKLVEDIREYNHTTAYKRSLSEWYTVEFLSDCFGFEIEYFNLHKQPEEIREIASRMGKYMMYGNAQELMYGDPEIAQTLCMKTGESAEKWKAYVENQSWQEMSFFSDGEIDEYLALVDGIAARLEMDTAYVTAKVLNREIVEDTWFSFISGSALLERIREYNALTAKNYRENVEEIVVTISLNFLSDEEAKAQYEQFDYFNRDPAIKLFVPLGAKCALYTNGDKLIYGSDGLGTALAGDGGSGTSQWPRFWMQDVLFHAETSHYFEIVDDILAKLSK